MSPFYMREFLQSGTEILWCVVERQQDNGILEIWASGSATPGFEGVIRRAYTIMAEALNAHGDELEQLTRDVKR